MQAQYEFSRGDQFQRFLDALLRFGDQDNIVGVTIDFHPIWWWLATFWHASGGIDYPVLGLPFPIFRSQQLMPRPDPTWTNPTWTSICKNFGKESPFIVKICYRLGAPSEVRNRLRDFAREWRFFCIAEERPLAVAASSFDSGRELVANEPGTLGGFFADGNSSRKYGVTCAHVGQNAGTSVSLEDSAGVNQQNVGSVTHSSFNSLTPLGSGQPCNRALHGIKAQVDVALIELNQSHSALKTIPSIGTIDTIFDRTQFGSGDSVEMRGAVSKHNSYFVGGYDVLYKVLFKNGNLHCFEHLFEINRQALTSAWMPPALSAKAVHGDSGACVCRPSPTGNFAYCGTLIAVDGTNGYACFAESVRTWAASLTPSIDLVPL